MRTRTRTSTTIREDRHTLRGFCVRLGTILIAGVIASGAGAQSRWVTWGGSFQLPPPPAGTEYLQFDIHNHIVAVLSDGTIQAWGDNSSGQCDVPTPPPGTHYVEVRAGNSFTVARLSDGNVLAWGYNAQGECDVPPLPPGLSYVQIDTGDGATIARRSDGSVIIWGDCFYGSCGEYQPPPGMAFVDVDADSCYFARLSDGSVVQFGQFGGCSAGNPPPLPPGVFYVEITSSCAGHALARRSDGSVVAWGLNDSGQCNVPVLPPGISYVEIEAGCTQTVLRRSDGAVLAFGDSNNGQLNVPTLPPRFVFGSITTKGPLTIARIDRLPPCGSIASYCWPPAANSTGIGASFEVDGCPGITANDLVFTVSGLPAQKFGLFVYGSKPRYLAYGNGWACVAGSFRRVKPGFVSDDQGKVTFPVDLTQFPFTGSGQAIEPGSAWNFQYWYRDPAGSPSNFNFSDAKNLVFAP